MSTPERGWTVHIATGNGNLDTVPYECIDSFVDLLAAYNGSVAFTAEGYGAMFSIQENVDENDPAERGSATRVASEGIAIFRALAADAGLPDLPIVHLEVLTYEEHDRELARPVVPELVGVSEIADILAVSRQRAHQLTKRADFPAPVQKLQAGPVWTRLSLERFIEKWRAGKPDVGTIVASVNGLIVELTQMRNHLVHDKDVPPTPSLEDLLERARSSPQSNGVGELLAQLVHENATRASGAPAAH